MPNFYALSQMQTNLLSVLNSHRHNCIFVQKYEMENLLNSKNLLAIDGDERGKNKWGQIIPYMYMQYFILHQPLIKLINTPYDKKNIPLMPYTLNI